MARLTPYQRRTGFRRTYRRYWESSLGEKEKENLKEEENPGGAELATDEVLACRWELWTVARRGVYCAALCTCRNSEVFCELATLSIALQSPLKTERAVTHSSFVENRI